MIKVDRKFTADIISPFNIFVIPLSVILGISIIYSSINDSLEPIGPKLILLYLVFFLIFWIINITFNVLIKKIVITKKSEILSETVKLNEKINKVMLFVGLMASTYLIINFYISAGSLNVIGSIVQEEFQESYSGGLNFYLRLICIISATYFLGNIKKGKKVEVIVAIICLIPLFLSFVKGIIFIPIISGFLYKKLLNKNLNFTKSLFSISLIGIFIFFAVYLFEYGIWDVKIIFDKNLYIFIFNKLIVYVISGTLSFNSNLNSGSFHLLLTNENPNLGIIINSFSKIGIGERIETIANQWTYIGSFKEVGSTYVNVNGMIGSLILYSGYTMGTIIFIFYCILVCLLYVRSKYSGNLIYKLSYALFISAFFLAWFENYFFHTFWLYIFIYLELMGILIYFQKKIKH